MGYYYCDFGGMETTAEDVSTKAGEFEDKISKYNFDMISTVTSHWEGDLTRDTFTNDVLESLIEKLYQTKNIADNLSAFIEQAKRAVEELDKNLADLEI